jgi:hypothetical protein
VSASTSFSDDIRGFDRTATSSGSGVGDRTATSGGPSTEPRRRRDPGLGPARPRA